LRQCGVFVPHAALKEPPSGGSFVVRAIVKRKRKRERCRIRRAPSDIEVEEKVYEVASELRRHSISRARPGTGHPDWRGAVALLSGVRDVAGNGLLVPVCGACVSDGADVELDRAVLGRSAGFCCGAVTLFDLAPVRSRQAAVSAIPHRPALSTFRSGVRG
jgi:hypothetical protein